MTQGTLLHEWHGHDPAYWKALWRAGEVRFYDAVGSTNDVVAQLASESAPNLSLAVAEEQTRGRGRGGASWQAPRGSALLFSVLFRTGGPGSAPGCAPIRIGLAVCDAIERLAGVRPQLKWPNDVVLGGGGKVAGILCEGVFGQRGSAHIVAGIGINVRQAASDFPTELRGSACSIASATGRIIDPAALLTAIVGNLHTVAPRIVEVLEADEIARFENRDVLREQDVICQMNDDSISGIARGIAQDGALLIEQQGELRAVYNGTVRLAKTHAYPGGTP